MTISTAESELMELVDAVSAGESIASVLTEIVFPITKFGWCHNQATISTVTNLAVGKQDLSEYGQFFFGSWLLQDMASSTLGWERHDCRLGDKGFLSAVRLRYLCRLLGMGKPGRIGKQADLPEADAPGNAEKATRDISEGEKII